MLSGVSGPSFAPTLDIGRDVPGLAPSSGVTGGVTAPSIRTEPLSPDFGTVLGQMAMDAIDKVKGRRIDGRRRCSRSGDHAAGRSRPSWPRANAAGGHRHPRQGCFGVSRDQPDDDLTLS